MDNLLSEKLDTWLSNTNGKPKNIVVYGPTGCGKSKMAIEIGSYLKRQKKLTPFIVSVDARQIYRGLNIGTGKIQKNEMGDIPHFMLDIIDPSETTTVVDFKNEVEDIELWNNWKTQKNQSDIPILCGGTGLYIDSLVFKRSYPEIEADWNMRKELEEYRVQNGNEALWQMLYEIDPEYAKELHPNNYHYIMRGIEVMRLTGKSKLLNIDTPELYYDTFFITPYDGDRESLYIHINERVDDMFSSGLIEEVGYNIDVFTSSAPGLKTIGYKEVVDYLEGKISLDECKSLVKQHNRNYAKRQITWNKKYDYFTSGTSTGVNTSKQ